MSGLIRVSVIDDEPFMADRINRHATEYGGELVSTFTSADAVLQTIARQDSLLPSSVDVIYLDGQIPNRGGGRRVRSALEVAGLVLPQSDARFSPDHMVVVGCSSSDEVSEELGTFAPDGRPLVLDWVATDLGIARVFEAVRQLKLEQ